MDIKEFLACLGLCGAIHINSSSIRGLSGLGLRKCDMAVFLVAKGNSRASAGFEPRASL
jgi:hypothetical protein